MAFTVIVRQSVTTDPNSRAAATAQRVSDATEAGCLAVRVLRADSPTGDLFAISDWETRIGALRFFEAAADRDKSLVATPGHAELRGGAGTFHMILLEPFETVPPGH